MKENTLHDFGVMSFNKAKMKERLPYPVYLKWKNAVRNEEDLDRETADDIAHAMKTWAIENGATHYSHWFQPLNGLTAKKHESFMDRGEDMEPMIRFSGKELIKGEPDASSFPNGGMRSTFEARGYTYWDCTANSFIMDNVLYIPTIFVSYHGEKLDKRAPLLASMNLVSEHGTRLANLFAKEEHTYRLRSKVGLEQEFFLIDKELYLRRTDLKACGRTLVGARPPKGQELDDHYFGSIPQRVADFYADVNEQLWKLGIFAKTEHNEVAPGQFEVAVLYENTNVSIDNNQLCMNILKKTALRHGLVCLLHEKPFDRVNGSGKHNNYSLATNYGLNCFDPGEDPKDNILFLLFLAAMIEATDDYAELLRVASSGPSNDNRLGGQEAPPAIISMYLGEDLEEVLRSVVEEDFQPKLDVKEIRVNSLAYVPRDTSDRNRTSPFAFTGNKFEFRMLGSSRSAADVNIVLNTAMGDVLQKMAEALEPYAESEDLKDRAYGLVREIVKKHRRILFSGDNYSREWLEEAKRRGLPNHPTYFEALKHAKNKDLLDVFVRHDILNLTELKAIYEIGMEEVVNVHSLEGRTYLTLISKDILPSAMAQCREYAEYLELMDNREVEKKKNRLNGLIEEMIQLEGILRETLEKSEKGTVEERAEFLQYEAVPLFNKIRELSNEMEEMTSRDRWKLPSYEDMFQSILS